MKKLFGRWLGESCYDEIRSFIFRLVLKDEKEIPPDHFLLDVIDLFNKPRMEFAKTNRSAFLNYLRARYERSIRTIENQSSPYFLAIDPSSICQLRCPWCPTGAENAHKKASEALSFRTRTMMDTALLDSLLDELGDNLFYILFYNWGEPLLNKRLFEFIQKAKRYQIYTEIHTNLSLPLTDEFMETLLSSGIDEIGASIDGFSQESYETYRQGGNLELAKGNLTRLAKIRDRLGLHTKIIWNFLVFGFNEHEIELTRQYCNEIGVEFNQRTAYIDIQEHPDWLPSHRKSELVTKEEPQNDPKIAAPKQKSLNSCSWHYSISVVNADGMVSPCCAPWDQKDDFGKVIPGGVRFRDVWNNDNFRKARGSFASKQVQGLEHVKTICGRCPFPDAVKEQYWFINRYVEANYWRTSGLKDPIISLALRLLKFSPKGFRWFYRNFVDRRLN